MQLPRRRCNHSQPRRLSVRPLPLSQASPLGASRMKLLRCRSAQCAATRMLHPHHMRVCPSEQGPPAAHSLALQRKVHEHVLPPVVEVAPSPLPQGEEQPTALEDGGDASGPCPPPRFVAHASKGALQRRATLSIVRELQAAGRPLTMSSEGAPVRERQLLP